MQQSIQANLPSVRDGLNVEAQRYVATLPSAGSELCLSQQSRENLDYLRSYRFFNPRRLREAGLFVEQFGHAIYSNLPVQADLAMAELRDVADADKVECVLDLADQIGLPMILFAKTSRRDLETIQMGDASTWRIQWTLMRIDRYNARIPLAAMRCLSHLKSHGLQFEELFIAEKHNRPDPALIGRIGKYLLEICRWE